MKSITSAICVFLILATYSGPAMAMGKGRTGSKGGIDFSSVRKLKTVYIAGRDALTPTQPNDILSITLAMEEVGKKAMNKAIANCRSLGGKAFRMRFPGQWIFRSELADEKFANPGNCYTGDEAQVTFCEAQALVECQVDDSIVIPTEFLPTDTSTEAPISDVSTIRQ